MKMENIQIKELVSDLQDFYFLSLHGLVGLVRRPFYLKDIVEQMEYSGAGSFFIILLISLFIGMALSLQLSTELAGMGFKM